MNTLGKDELTRWFGLAGLAALMVSAAVASGLEGVKLCVPMVALATISLGARSAIQSSEA